MENGIVCKVWNIQGNTMKKTTSSQLTDSIGYILNEEKTDIQLKMEGSNISDPLGQLGRECRYVENDIKTVDGAYVGSRNLISSNIREAVNEMMDVKKFFGKLDGRAALHGIISLPVPESNMCNASALMQLCEKVLEEVFPNNQAIFGVHTNTENLHIHFIINSVGLDGKKIHQDDKFIKNVLHPCINKYAKEFGFTPNEKWEKEKSEQKYSFAQMKIKLRKAIDESIEESSNFDEFIKNLKGKGYIVNIGKFISVKNADMEKAIRTHNLGYSYSKESIVERILTKKERLDSPVLHDYIMKEKRTDIFMPTIMKMKRYKDMEPDQKKYVVRQLKLGNNPWREHQQLNWQLNNIANELNIQNRVNSYVEFYSVDGTLQGTLDGIIEAKKHIASEKKIIMLQKRKYKPIIDIYEEMKKIQRKAYLYEYENISEFRPEFEQYRELTRRLKRGYDKDVIEIAKFLEECDERLLYAHAQLHELSLEYREIKQYAATRGETLKSTGKLLDAIGVYEDKENVKQNIYEANMFYIVSDNPEVILRVVKSPQASENGKLIEEYEVTAISIHGDILEQINSQGDIKNFQIKMKQLEKKYELNDCKRFTDIINARDYLEKNKKNIGTSESVKKGTVDFDTTLSFTQAINHCNNESKACIVVDAKSQNYYISSVMGTEEIKLIAYSKDGKIQESINIPLVSEKTSDGYKKIANFQKKYGISDHVYVFNGLEEAKAYINKENMEPENNPKESKNGGYKI